MRFHNRKRHWIAGIAALALCMAVLFPQLSAFAENTIDVERLCSLEIHTAEQNEEAWADLKDVPVTVDLYRVASVDKDAAPTAIAPFDDESIDMAGLPDGGDAKAEELTAQLEAFLKENRDTEPYQTVEITGSGTVEELPTGVYLIVPEQKDLGDRAYRFSPSLTFLPRSGLIPGAEGGQDLYPLEYDATLLLKKEQVALFGKLLIEKTLTSYAEGKAADFVFSVEGVKDGKTVYSDVVPIKFTAPGVKQQLIERIPAGTEVTVTEIYSGAGYKLTSARSVTVTVEAEAEDADPVKVSFVNECDGSRKQGASVVNHFEYGENTGAWTWQPDDKN